MPRSGLSLLNLSYGGAILTQILALGDLLNLHILRIVEEDHKAAIQRK